MYRPVGSVLPVSIGERIDERLKALKWSQAKLARETGLPQTTVNGLVRGSARMTPHLVPIAKALGTTPEYLTGATNDPDAETFLPELSYEQRQLLACFDSLNTTDRQLLLAMAMRMADRDGPDRVHAAMTTFQAEPAKA